MSESSAEPKIRPQGKFFALLDNFWYHYKWHTLIALFFLVFITVCTLQMCGKENYDAYILYAGDKNVSKKSQEGLPSEHAVMTSGWKRTVPDVNGDGKVSVCFETLFYLSPAQLSDPDAIAGKDFNSAMLSQNTEALDTYMLQSDYYLLLMSEAAYVQYRNRSPGLFADLTEIVGDADVDSFDSGAVRLSSTTLGKSAGFKDLPEDTVVCLRTLSEVTLKWDRKNATKKYGTAVDVLKSIL